MNTGLIVVFRSRHKFDLFVLNGLAEGGSRNVDDP